SLLHVAEDELEWQARGREVEREYEPIAALVKHEGTRKWGCDAFRKFHKVYPDYDPDNLAAYCLTLDSPRFDWCDIPGGEIRLRREGAARVLRIASFQIGKYPVTSAQFQEFVDASDGYRDEHWWDFSGDALAWRKAHPEPIQTKKPVHDHPAVNVCWYEAVAFCRWYSSRTGDTIVLPNELQWQWAAQGDDGRSYPWGNVFESTRCNTSEGKMGRTMPVSYHMSGASPYGVLDMAGNVWEWCANTEDRVMTVTLTGDRKRIVKGGSFIGNAERATCKFRYALKPESRFTSIGFRLVRLNY
ncbi:MAG: formylglycine-generating enzyme family protein, partial [Anaerolineae bacterium]|nr:formylglycine-generating enzyme family protein [Anaerolineae bacterium]